MATPFPEKFGFRIGDRGTHTSRTLMLSELSTLLSVCPPDSIREAYRRAIVEDNAVGKATASTRRLTGQRLSELYALDPGVMIFRGLRYFSDRDRDSLPLIALLCGLARDPLLRSTVAAITDLREEEAYDREKMKNTLSQAVNGRLNDNVIEKVSRNAASSWTQSGHLVGRTFKKRRYVYPGPGAVAMALLLGYLQGIRGGGLLNTVWCRVLDVSSDKVASLAAKGVNQRLLRFRKAGEVIEVAFPNLITAQEAEVGYESN